jgi:hypothetical protein
MRVIEPHARSFIASGSGVQMVLDGNREPRSYNRRMIPSPDAQVQVQILPLDGRHNEAMLAILHQSPIETGGLSICFDRLPNIFAMADFKYNPAVWNGFFDEGKLEGFVMFGHHDAYVNGSVTQVMHITDCYIKPRARGRGYLKAAIPSLFSEGRRGASLGYGVIMKGNRAAEAQVGDRFAAGPESLRSRIVGAVVAKNILITFARRKRTRLPVRLARAEDIDDIVTLLRAEHSRRLFGLVVDRDQFAAQLEQRPGLSIDNYYVVERDGKLAGVCAAWDTSAFKQNRVVRYGWGLKIVRAANLLTAPIGGFSKLPAPGNAFRDAFVTDWAVRDRSVEVMQALLDHVYREYRDRHYHSLIFGSSVGDPMLEATRGFQTTSIVSNVALFPLEKRWREDGAIDTRSPYIDLALL